MSKSPTIVVIEDDAVTLKVLSIVLNNEDVDVHCAPNAKVGLDIDGDAFAELVVGRVTSLDG